MKKQNKQIGIALLVIGAILLTWGYDVSGSFSAQINKAFTGSVPDKAMYLYIGGAVCVVLGLYRLFK